MAIGLSAYKKYGAKASEAARQAEVYKKQQKKAKSRGFFSSILGKGLGGLLGAGLSGFLGIASGGLLAPLMGAIGQFGGKKLAYEATRGMAADPSKIKAEGKYGFGKEGAKTLREQLESESVQDPFKVKGGFGADVLSSYLSAGMSGQLGGVKGALKGTAKDMAGQVTSADKAKKWGQFWRGGEGDVVGLGKDVKGFEGALSSVGDLFGESWGKTDVEESQYDPFAVSENVDESTYDPFAVSEEIPGFQQGGLVQNKPPTIADFFGMHGKTLGGSNKQSIAEILGKK